MVVLRSREVLPTKPASKPLTNRATPEPVTPVQFRELSTRQSPLSLTPNLETHQLDSDSGSASFRRRSLRIASKSVPDNGCIQNEPRSRNSAATMRSVEEKEGIEEGNRCPLLDQINNVGSAEVNGVGMDVDGNFSGILNLRSGKRVVRRRVGYSGYNSVTEAGTERKGKGLISDKNGSSKRTSELVIEGKGKGKLGEEKKFDNGHVVENLNDNAIREMIETGEGSEVAGVDEKLEEKQNPDESDNSRGRKRCAREEIRKRGEDVFVTVKLEKTQNQSSNSRLRRRYSQEEKGKEKLIDDASVSNGKDALDLELELKSKVKEFVDSMGDNVALESERNTRNANTRRNGSRMEQFRDIARKNASRFANFDLQEKEEERLSPQVDVEMAYVEENQKIEDWPGPFSTAMKIIRDRTNKLNLQQGPSILEKATSVPITWIPRNSQGSNRSRAFVVPLLQELCMKVLVDNCEAVTSLEHVPDALRHRLCHLLCSCRRMNSNFLDLLVRGSPTEIRIKDCSWLTEEDFVKCFEACDTNNLTVFIQDLLFIY